MKQLLKSLLASIFFVAVMGNIFAQTSDAYEMMIDGVKVIVNPGHNDIVEIQTIIKGGVQNYDADKSGIENLAMNALTECGTATLDKNTFKNKLDKVSAWMYGYSDMDYASFTMNCIKGDLEQVWPLYAEAFTSPRFDAKEFTRIKQDAINNLKAAQSSPDYAINRMAKEIAFAGKHSSMNPQGTEASLERITVEEAKSYFHSIATKSKMLMVVVGDIERSKLETMIKMMLASVPQGKPFNIRKEAYAPNKNTFASEKKEFATNYIQAVTGGPLPGTKEFNSFLLAMRIFADRNFLEVRTNNGLSYAPSAGFDQTLSPSANFGVSTTDPNKYIKVINDLIYKTKSKGFTEEEVRNKKTTYITGVYYNHETNSAIASSLADNEVLHNNWRRTMTLNEDLKNITPTDVANVFNKYVNNLTWVYQGDQSKVDQNLYTAVYKPHTKNSKLPPSKFSSKKINK